MSKQRALPAAGRSLNLSSRAVDEPELTDEAAALLRDRFSFFEYPNSHMLAYLVPGEHEAIEPGKRRYNWVWYRNAAENRLAELLIDAAGRQRASSMPPGLLSAASETDPAR